MSDDPDALSWSVQYRDLASVPPEGYAISERVLPPRLVVRRTNNGFEVVLCGVRMIRTEERVLDAFSTAHNWVLDGTTIRPLPRDVAEALTTAFTGSDLKQPSFSEVLAIARHTQDVVPVSVDPDVFAAAKGIATGMGEGFKVPGLQATPFPYQTDGIAWMHRTLAATGGLVLADEMGLGKTIQIIALLLLEPPDTEAPALVICPTSLITNWQREIERFGPSLSILQHRGAYRTGIVSGLRKAQVVIATYDTVVNDIALFSGTRWSWVIADEAQAIKNPSASRRRALASIPRDRTIPMTGTPVENSLMDLWSLADFAIPGLLGTREEFGRLYPDGTEAAQEISDMTSPIVLRRRVADVADDLPQRTDVDVPLSLGDDLAREYKMLLAETLEEYPVAGALVATGRLQMFCAHPMLRSRQGHDGEDPDSDAIADVEAGRIMPTPKLERTVDLVHEAFANDRRVLIFSTFNRIGDILQSLLGNTPGMFWGTINGSTPADERQPLVDRFSEHAGPACMVLNPKAAGAGLNITAATVVIHYTQVWNPALEAQASARAHRRGQKHPVTIYRLFYEGTVEEVMIDRSAWKRKLGNEAVPVSTRDAGDLSRALSITPRGTS
ncbi:DEAD/DEAH box helicase [Pararhizobium sp. IMCC21322]|uniref:DEAD/DEAH box helicase n=1 Tax=Pararhizobium sp. IMCC21322 TaxID=3067903 RepID=UPI002741F8C4|nr:DEAD/DEAH box helicase [Pararhizobium sp. IMCC21322]